MKRILAMLLAALLALGSLAALAEADLIGVEADVETPVEELDGALWSDETAQAESAADPGEEAAVPNAAKGTKINAANFPDKAFRAYVKATYDGNGNGYLSAAEVKGVTEMWLGVQEGCTPVNCKNLKGIQYFTDLKELFILGNDEVTLPLTSLDVSKNTKLKTLIVCFTKLTSLDVTKNTKLVELNVGTNRVKTLTLGKLPKLEKLTCDNNRLTKLDVSKCAKLSYLQCEMNKLSTLTLGKLTKLTELYCFDNQLTKLDVSKCAALVTLSCGNNKIAKLNVKNNTKLKVLYAYLNKLTALDVSKNTKLVELHVAEQSGKGIAAIDVSNMKNLTILDVSINHRISTINVTNCPKLVHLDVTGNKLTELDVRKNTKLQKLWLEGNQISSLNVSKLTKLTHLWCGGNQLKTVDVSKNTKLVSFRCHDNPIESYDIAKLPKKLKALAKRNDIREVSEDEGAIRWYVSEDEQLYFPIWTKLVNGSKTVYEPQTEE